MNPEKHPSIFASALFAAFAGAAAP